MFKRIVFLLLFVCLFYPLSVQAGRTATDSANALKFESYYGLFPDEATQKRIAELGEKLVIANGLPKEEFTFKVINSGEVNAVTLPGGYIYVYKGLIDFMPSDDEIASVIGHEIGHVTGNHSARRQREQLLAMLFGAVLGGPEAAIAANAALASLPAYNQRDEREADDSGFNYMLKAGMNPYSILVVMHKLGETDNAQIRSNFAVHPEPLERAARISRYLQGLQIQPLVYSGKNSATIQDGGWAFTIRQPFANDLPLYRAWLLAGNLYCIANGKNNLVKDKFIVVEESDVARIYYDDLLVYSIGQLDILAERQTASQKAAEYVEAFRSWMDTKVGSI